MKQRFKLLLSLAIFSLGTAVYSQGDTLLKYEKGTIYKITTYILVIVIISLLAKYRWIKDLHKKAYFDELTTAKNKTRFKKEMGRLNFESNRGLGMFLDLDNFKRINDTYGHHMGDLVLKEVVKRLHKIFDHKSIYRLSGDEFFILHKNIEEDDIERTAAETLKELRKPLKILGATLKVHGSIGICPMSPKIKNTSEFLHRADVAMYTAKKNGKGTFVVADDQMIEKFDRYRQLEKDFIHQLENKEIFPYFQPKVELETEKIVGVEALARWIHPEEGFITPGVFIPIAEKNEVIADLDFLIAESAIKSLKNWIEEGIVGDDFKLSFNISVKTLEGLDVYDHIENMLKKYDVSGDRVQIEITESIFINNIQKVLYEMNLLKERLGISIALDDFTAGHASLKGLGVLEIDTLKFDRSLLQIVKENVDKGQRIYSTLIHLSDDMGYISVAEGIENAAESEFLKKEGVKYAQGFHFGRPMPEKDLVAILIDERSELKLKKKYLQ